MNRWRNIALVVVFLVVLAALSTGAYMLSRPALLQKPPQSTPQTETTISILSEIPGITITRKETSEATSQLIQALANLKLYPLKQVPFMAPVGTGYPFSYISPSAITIVFRDRAKLDADEQYSEILTNRRLYEEVGRAVYFLGTYTEASRTLTIPVYVVPGVVTNPTARPSPDLYFSQAAVEAIFFNLQAFPISSLGKNPGQTFFDRVGTFTTPVLTVSLPSGMMRSVQQLVSFLVPEAYAVTCTGSAVCGTVTNVQGTCSISGFQCWNDSSCTAGPGDTCVGAIVGACGMPTTPGSCDVVGGAGGNSCGPVCFSCGFSSSCAVSTPPPGPTPTPIPGGGPAPGCGQCNTCGIPQWCNLLSSGACVVDSCACAGIGCGGSPPGDPCPADSCAGTCCNFTCGQPCIVTADCKSPSTAGYTIQCLAPNPSNPSAKYCVNIMCPAGTDPGTICGCSGNTILCGNTCAGGCEPNSICTFTDPTCANPSTTYCVGTKNPNPPTASSPYTSYNPDYVGNLCSPGAWHLVQQSTGQQSGFTQAQITSTCPSATINVRGHYISPSDISCAAITASTSYTTGTVFGLSPAVSPTTQTQSGSAYLAWTQVPAATYSLLSTPPSGAVLQNACWTRSPTTPANGSSTSITVTTADTVNWDIGYSLGTPWVQTKGGDVIVKDTIKSLMTSLASPRLFSVNGDGGYPGNVSYGSSGAAPYNFNSDVSDTTYGRNYVSSTNWLANEPGDGFSKDPFLTDWYQYFLYQLDLSPASGAVADFTNPVAPVTKPTTPSRQTLPYAYLVSGDMTTSGDWTIGANETMIFLVSGNVTIKGKINITPGGFFAMIANGNITIDPTVGVAYSSSTPVIEGLYVTSKTGSFQTGQSTNAGTERFVGKGSFVAGSFLLQRDLSSVGHNADTSAELFLYNPQLLLTMPDKMKDMKITWREVAP